MPSSFQYSQPELYQANHTWFHFFHDLVRSGRWARMTFPAKAVYPCLKSHCNYENGKAFPSIEKLVVLSGVSVPSVIKALRELEALGLISADKKNGKSTIYKIKEIIQPINQGGQPAGNQISFDYIPSMTAKALDQLKEYIKGGMSRTPRNATFNLLNITINNIVNIKQQQEYGSIDSSKVLQGTMDRLAGVDSEEARYAEIIEAGETP